MARRLAAKISAAKGPRRRAVEPWQANYYAALRHRSEPLVYLLVSWEEAIQVADGLVPARVRKQARRLLEWPAPPQDI